MRRDALEHSEGRQISWEEMHFKLIESFAPPSLIVTRNYDIVHVSENANRFLHFSSGQPSVNLLNVVNPMLRVELRAALFRAAQQETTAEAYRIPVELEGKMVLVDVRVSPAQEIAPDYLLVIFEVRPPAEGEVPRPPAENEPAVRQMEREIRGHEAAAARNHRAVRSEPGGTQGGERRAPGDERGTALLRAKNWRPRAKNSRASTRNSRR